MEIYDRTFLVLQKALDLRVVGNRITTSNLANIDTPGYQANRLDFEASMQRALDEIDAAGEISLTINQFDALASQGSRGSDPWVDPIINPTGDAPIGLDGNNVDMEGELNELGANSMMYRLTAQLLSAKLRQIRSVLDNEAGG